LSTTDHLPHPELDELDRDTRLTLALNLDEAEALRAWLLRASAEGTNSLDEPLVSGCLTKLARALDALHAIANVRRELEQAGLDIAHLSDEQVAELGRRVSDAAAVPAIRG
jgi:hypothetical protein